MPVVRVAGAEDFAGVRALADPALLPALFDACLEDGCALVAEAGGALVGLLLARPLAYDGDTPITLWIEAVAVAPAWPRDDITAALYRALGTRAADAGTRGILVAADHGNPAADAVRRRVGFAPHREGLLLWRFDEG